MARIQRSGVDRVLLSCFGAAASKFKPANKKAFNKIIADADLYGDELKRQIKNEVFNKLSAEEKVSLLNAINPGRALSAATGACQRVEDMTDFTKVLKTIDAYSAAIDNDSNPAHNALLDVELGRENKSQRNKKTKRNLIIAGASVLGAATTAVSLGLGLVNKDRQESYSKINEYLTANDNAMLKAFMNLSDEVKLPEGFTVKNSGDVEKFLNAATEYIGNLGNTISGLNTENGELKGTNSTLETTNKQLSTMNETLTAENGKYAASLAVARIAVDSVLDYFNIEIVDEEGNPVKDEEGNVMHVDLGVLQDLMAANKQDFSHGEDISYALDFIKTQCEVEHANIKAEIDKAFKTDAFATEVKDEEGNVTKTYPTVDKDFGGDISKAITALGERAEELEGSNLELVNQIKKLEQDHLKALDEKDAQITELKTKIGTLEKQLEDFRKEQQNTEQGNTKNPGVSEDNQHVSGDVEDEKTNPGSDAGKGETGGGNSTIPNEEDLARKL